MQKQEIDQLAREIAIDDYFADLANPRATSFEKDYALGQLANDFRPITPKEARKVLQAVIVNISNYI